MALTHRNTNHKNGIFKADDFDISRGDQEIKIIGVDGLVGLAHDPQVDRIESQLGQNTGKNGGDAALGMEKTGDQAGEQACRAAAFLADCLKNYKPNEIAANLTAMHNIEHAGDVKKHEMSAALAKAFVTPVDREDLALISHNIDDVTDSIEEILQRFYVDQIQVVLPEAIVFADKLVQCCKLMTEMLGEFSNFKKPARLHEMIVELNHAEEECDRLYLTAARSVREKGLDPLDVLAWREIYDCMEECADACEHVSECVGSVIMKNT